MEQTQDIRNLPCLLDDEDRALRGRWLASKLLTLEEVKAEASEKAKEYKTQKDGLEDEIAKLRDAVDTGKEVRPVPCTARPDARRFCIEIIRHDTLEVVETRAMTKDEIEEHQQPRLFDERSTAHGRDDRPPPEAPPGNDTQPIPPGEVPAPAEGAQATPPPAEGDQQQAAAERPTAVPGQCVTCGEIGGHALDCAELGAAPPAAGTEITDPGSVLAGGEPGEAEAKH